MEEAHHDLSVTGDKGAHALSPITILTYLEDPNTPISSLAMLVSMMQQCW